MRTKTNFQAVQELMTKFTPSRHGVSTLEEITLIQNILELDGRDDLELNDIRDMAVAIYAQSAEAGEKNGAGVQAVMAKMDAMSAITGVIDQEIADRNMPGGQVKSYPGTARYAVATCDGLKFMQSDGQPELDADPAGARLFRTPDQACAMSAYAAKQYNQAMMVVRVETRRTVFPVLDMITEQKKAEADNNQNVTKGGSNNHGENI